MDRPGQNILIVLPIIQILYSQFNSLIFNLMSPIIQIQFHCRFIGIYYGTTNNIRPLGTKNTILLLYSVFHQMSFLTKRTHVQMLPMMVERGVYHLCSFSPIWQLACMSSPMKHLQLVPIFQIVEMSTYYSKNYSRIFCPGLAMEPPFHTESTAD